MSKLTKEDTMSPEMKARAKHEEKEYQALKKVYEKSKNKPSGYYLCKIPDDGKVLFGSENPPFHYLELEETQQGYKRAVETTPVPEEDSCAKCGQYV